MSDEELTPYDLTAEPKARVLLSPGWAERLKELAPRWPPQEANPHRAGACPECGSCRTDGRPPYIHKDDCPHEGDLQLDRQSAERETGDHGGPVLYCDEHDHFIRAQP